MKHTYRFGAILLIFVFFIFYLSAQVKEDALQQSRQFFQKAEYSLEQKKYGDALRYANLAKKSREEEISKVIEMLNSALKPAEIQKQNTINQTVTALHERNLEEAAKLIQDLINQHGESFFDFSVHNIVEFYKRKSAYPEADFLLAKIFILEGEYQLAEKLLLEAWKNADILEIPEQKISILYESAYLAELTKNDDFYEEYLLLVIAEDENLSVLSGQNSLTESIVHSAKTSDNIEKYFLLYRLDSYNSIPALFQLAQFYKQKNLIEKSFYMSVLSSVASFSAIEQTVKERNLDYAYKNPSVLFDAASKHHDILAWADNNSVWEMFFLFSDLLHIQGNSKMADQMLTALYYHCPDKYWADLSLKRIQKSGQ